MMKSKLEFDGNAGQRVIDAGWEGFRRCVVFYWQACVNAVSVSANPTTVKVKRHTPGGNKYTRTVYLNPSKPGEPPHKRTGAGQASIKYEFDEQERSARVGIEVSGVHMAYLELAKEPHRRRPWLLATLEKVWGRMQLLAGGGR